MDRIARCSCGGDHFLSVRAFMIEDEPAEGYLDFHMGYYHGARADNIIDRLRQAWGIIRHGECLLSEFEMDRSVAIKVRNYLDEFIEECDAQ